MVEVAGARQLRSTLKKAGGSLDEIKAAHKQAAQIAARASAALAPTRTGRLADTIRAAGTNSAGIVRAGTKRAPYAQAVHWGRAYWPNARHARRTRSPVRAQPFISQGARNSEGQWLPVYEHVVEKSIQLVKGK